MSRRRLARLWDLGLVPPGARGAVLLPKPWPGHRAWGGEGGNQQSRSCELFGIHQQRLLLVKAGRQLRAINRIPAIFCWVVWKFYAGEPQSIFPIPGK